MDPIPWFEPSFDDQDAEAVKQTVLSTFVNEGPANRAFEQTLTRYFGVPHAITTPNCTTAISLALMACGIKHGDTVLVPDVTFIGTASAVKLAGALPILVDVDPVSFTMDPEDARRRIQSSTRAIVVVHLNGRPAPLRALQPLASQYGLALIEDAAEALGSRNAQGWLGTLSDAGCFSLAPTKIITSGQGGFVLTRRQEIRDAIVRLKDHGRLSRASDVHPVPGFNFKVTDLQAALALSQWSKLPERIRRSRDIDNRYREGLADIPDIVFTSRPDEGGFLMWPDFKSHRRDELAETLKKQAITVRPFWPALHLQPAYQSSDAYPGATEVCRQACWLPCSPGISNEAIDRVVRAIHDFYHKHP